jgi:hypothetical protein
MKKRLLDMDYCMNKGHCEAILRSFSLWIREHSPAKTTLSHSLSSSLFTMTIFLFSTNIHAERGDFFVKLYPSIIQFHDISTEEPATKYLKDYTKSRFFYSVNLGFGMHINENISLSIDGSYFPHGYTNLYNKQDISTLRTFETLSNDKLKPIKDAQNFILNQTYSIFLSMNYYFGALHKITPFIGAKIGYVDGKIGMDPAFYDTQEKIAADNKLTFTRNKNAEKLQIEMLKFAPMALSVEAGCSFRFKQNILFDITYEIARLKFENIIDRVIGATASDTLTSYGLKDYILIHKISAGFRFLL